MQSKILEDKEALKAWKKQLVIRPLEKEDTEEALKLVVDSTLKLSSVFQELAIEKEILYSYFRPDFEGENLKDRSFVLVDPSSNNKILSVKIMDDLSNLSTEPPKADNYPCSKLFYKAQINYELMEPILKENHKPLDYEYTVLFNIDPEYAKLGLAEYMNSVYGRHAFMRGVKKTINIYYNMFALKITARLKSGNPTVLNQLTLKDREFDGEKIFKTTEECYLQSMEVNEQVIKDVMQGDIIDEVKAGKKFDHKTFFKRFGAK